MHLSARADYAVRALVELAAAEGQPTRREHIATAQGIPIKFLNNIFQQLKVAGLVRTVRGADGGYLLTVRPQRITIADIIRAVDGPLANVRGERPENVAYAGSAEPLREVWIALRASMRSVLEHVTLYDVAHNQLPPVVHELSAGAGAWLPSQPGQPWHDEGRRAPQPTAAATVTPTGRPRRSAGAAVPAGTSGRKAKAAAQR